MPAEENPCSDSSGDWWATGCITKLVTDMNPDVMELADCFISSFVAHDLITHCSALWFSQKSTVLLFIPFQAPWWECWCLCLLPSTGPLCCRGAQPETVSPSLTASSGRNPSWSLTQVRLHCEQLFSPINTGQPQYETADSFLIEINKDVNKIRTSLRKYAVVRERASRGQHLFTQTLGSLAFDSQFWFLPFAQQERSFVWPMLPEVWILREFYYLTLLLTALCLLHYHHLMSASRCVHSHHYKSFFHYKQLLNFTPKKNKKQKPWLLVPLNRFLCFPAGLQWVIHADGPRAVVLVVDPDPPERGDPRGAALQSHYYLWGSRGASRPSAAAASTVWDKQCLQRVNALPGISHHCQTPCCR